MIAYYLYSRGVDGHYKAVAAKVYTSDAEALRAAEHLLALYPSVEIWKGDALIGEVARRQLPIAC